MPLPWQERFKRPGQFIKTYLENHGSASVAELHYFYKGEIEEENIRRKQLGEKAFHVPVYHSFYGYFRNLITLELVERVGERTAKDFRGPIEEFAFVERTDSRWKVIQGARERLWQLTEKGKFEITAWNDPLRALGFYPRTKKK